MSESTLYEKHEFENGIVEIHFDSDTCNPRKEFDHVGKMICWHRNYQLGDKHKHHDTDDLLWDLATDIHPDFPSRENVEWGDSVWRDRAWAIVNKHFVILPLYLYDHSGITMSTGAFSCPWDSGHVGWTYLRLEKARKDLFLSKEQPTPVEVRQHALEALESEVEEYDQYLTGQVFGFITYALGLDGEKDEELDSCWGFYGEKAALEAGKESLPTLDVNREFDLAEAALV